MLQGYHWSAVFIHTFLEKQSASVTKSSCVCLLLCVCVCVHANQCVCTCAPFLSSYTHAPSIKRPLCSLKWKKDCYSTTNCSEYKHRHSLFRPGIGLSYAESQSCYHRGLPWRASAQYVSSENRYLDSQIERDNPQNVFMVIMTNEKMFCVIDHALISHALTFWHVKSQRLTFGFLVFERRHWNVQILLDDKQLLEILFIWPLPLNPDFSDVECWAN